MQHDTFQKKWQPFEEAYLPGIDNVYEIMSRFNVGIDKAREIRYRFKNQKVYMNNRYQVNVEMVETAIMPMVWLSIKRLDKEPIHDWREMQRIKNEICGEEFEAVELYPAEDRLADSANQYHLWVIPFAGIRFGFGFPDRLVSGAEEAEAIGAKQRPFER